VRLIEQQKPWKNGALPFMVRQERFSKSIAATLGGPGMSVRNLENENRQYYL